MEILTPSHQQVYGDTKPLIPVVPPSQYSDSIPNDGIEVRITNGGGSVTSLLEGSSDNDTTTRGQPGLQEDEYAPWKTPSDPSKKESDTKLTPSSKTSEPSNPLDGKPSPGISKKAKAKLSPPTKPTALPNPQNGESPLQTNPKAKHKRFDTEDSLQEPLLTSEKNGVFEADSKLPLTVQVDGDSEDEAPETVSASTGLNQARIAAIEVAKLAQA